jgi:predicted dehydrogenase
MPELPLPRPLGVGIVGLTPGRSWAARAHVPALEALPEYDLVGVASSSAESAAAAARALDIPRWYPTVQELVEDPDVDIVAVTVKVPHHREIVDAALAAHTMVYCEWPLGNGLADAEAMADTARRHGIRTAVGLQARSSPTIRYVRDLVRDGFVGEVLSTTMVGSSGSMGASDPEHLVYLNDRSKGANVLTIPFGHAIDALCWVLGEFREVSATLATRRKTYVVTETQETRTRDIADQVLVNGTLVNDVVVAAHYRGGSLRATNFRWEINGTEGDIVITAPSGQAQAAELTLRGARGASSDLELLPVPAEYRVSPDGLPRTAVNVAEAYARFAQGPSAPDQIPDFDDAVRLHRLLDAIERSAASGARILLEGDEHGQ